MATETELLEHQYMRIQSLVAEVARLRDTNAQFERLKEVLRECRRYINATPAPSDLWAIGLCRELDEVLKGPLPVIPDPNAQRERDLGRRAGQ